MKVYEEDKYLIDIFYKLLKLHIILNPPIDKKTAKFFGIPPNSGIMTIEEKKNIQTQHDELDEEFFESWIMLDRIEIRESPLTKTGITVLRKHIMDFFDFDESWEFEYEKFIDWHEDSGVLNRSNIICNYYKLKPPYVQIGTEIPKGIRNICNESRLCFVYGQFSASVALSRTVIETVLQHKFELFGDVEQRINQAKKHNLICGRAAWNAHKVRKLANKILHKANIATEKQALNAIDHTLDFVEEVYFSC